MDLWDLWLGWGMVFLVFILAMIILGSKQTGRKHSHSKKHSHSSNPNHVWFYFDGYDSDDCSDGSGDYGGGSDGGSSCSGSSCSGSSCSGSST